MLRRTRWEAFVSALEAIQGTNDAFTSDELYTYLRCFEEKLKQAGDYHVEPKQVVFSTQSNVKHFHPSTSCENFIQSLDHEVFKDVKLLSKIFQGMLNFEKKFNKEREEHDKNVICFDVTRKNIPYILASFFSLISRVPMTQVAQTEKTNLQSMVLQEKEK
jgi:hypothetical protein